MAKTTKRRSTRTSQLLGTRARRRRSKPVVVKLGGELLEDARRLRRLALALARIAVRSPLVVVHGGGREIDADMVRLGIQKRMVDGLRITDTATLDVVVGVLAGRVNTRLGAAVCAAGASAVGLTGADGTIVQVRRARRYRSVDGTYVDLGFVGQPVGDNHPTLLLDLYTAGYVPVVASIGTDARGRLFNVNADTLAGNLATRLGARQLIIAGGTAGVLDASGRTIPKVDDAMIDHLITGGQAGAGMIAKLLACRTAGLNGVTDVTIVDGRRAALTVASGTAVVMNQTVRSKNT